MGDTNRNHYSYSWFENPKYEVGTSEARMLAGGDFTTLQGAPAVPGLSYTVEAWVSTQLVNSWVRLIA